MKNKVLAMMIGITAALTTNAQVNYRMQTACHPEDVKTYTTEKLRERFVMEKVLSEDAIHLTYSMYDRLIFLVFQGTGCD